MQSANSEIKQYSTLSVSNGFFKEDIYIYYEDIGIKLTTRIISASQ